MSDHKIHFPAIKDMAANLERKWRNQFVFMQDQVIPVDDDVQGESCHCRFRVGPSNLLFSSRVDAKQKKRKLPDLSSKVGPPAKKSAVSAASSSRPSVIVKKEGKPTTTTTVTAAGTVKESKSDSSFFSAPKQKPRLPSFKKAPVGTTALATTKEPLANVAQPSSTDAFQEALKDMRARKPSPSAPSTSSNNALASSSVLATAKPLKKKSVTWAPDGQLELVKLIERAVYDDDPVDVSRIFLSIIVHYINYVPPMLIHRVRHTQCTMYVNWIEVKAPPYTPTCSKSFSIGPSHNVSVTHLQSSHAALTPHLILSH